MQVDDRPRQVMMNFRAFTGRFVTHCHKLNHEDEGMMELFDFCAQGDAACRCQRMEADGTCVSPPRRGSATSARVGAEARRVWYDRRALNAPPIEEIVQAGLAFNPRLRMPIDDVRAKVGALFQTLDDGGIPYLLVGGVALLSYVNGRNTQDVDLILDAADLGRVGWSVTGRDQDFARADFHGLRVALLLTDNALFDGVRRDHAGTAAFGDRVVPCASREGLLLLKLYALPALYRQGEFDRAALYETDILMLHRGADVDDDALLAVLGAYLSPGDIGELRGILAEQRGRRRFGAP